MDDEIPPPISYEAIQKVALASSPDAPAQARAELTAWLRQVPLDDTLIDDARLLVSELVTNSFRHARIAPDQPLRLTMSLRAARLRLELHDAGTDGEVERRPPRVDDRAGGFGLDFIARISSAWGVDRNAHGTTVWLELATG